MSSYGNTNLGASNDQAEALAYLLAGTGDDKTDIVVYAEEYNRAAIYSRDRDISSNADFRPFGGIDARWGDFAGRVRSYVYQPKLNRGSPSPTRHAFPNVAHDPQYVPFSTIPPSQQPLFNFAEFTTAMPPVDREYLSTARSTTKFATNIWSSLPISNTCVDSANAALAPVRFATDVFTDINHPLGISPAGFSLPIQNPFNPFTVADYISPGGADPKFPGTQMSVVPSGTQLYRRALHCLGSSAAVPTRLQLITTSLPVVLKVA